MNGAIAMLAGFVNTYIGWRSDPQLSVSPNPGREARTVGASCGDDEDNVDGRPLMDVQPGPGGL